MKLPFSKANTDSNLSSDVVVTSIQTEGRPRNEVLMLAGGSLFVSVALIGLGFFFFRPSSSSDATLRRAEAQAAKKQAQGSTGGSSAGAAQSGQSNAAAPSSGKPCTVKDMPQQVCQAIDSVEARGVKNNAYVVADTSHVLPGTTIKVDRSSWKPISSTEGTIILQATSLGITYQAFARLRVIGNTWKVTDYIVY